MNQDLPVRAPQQSSPRGVQLAPGLAVGVSVVMVLAISVGDFLTGPYLVFATFYLIPVMITAWFAGRTPALVVGALAALLGAVSTALDPGDVTPPVYVWNGAFRFITYAFVAALVDAEQRALTTIRLASAIDPLTGLMNRRRFFEQAELEMRRARRSGEPIAVVYIDVDDLKLRNDICGHQAGDELLTEFADRARDTFRVTDLLSRLGGDEFCFLLPGADLAVAEDALDRFGTALSRATPPIRVSTGVVAGTVDSDVDIDVETIVHEADALMYEAKMSAKGQRRSRPSLRGPEPRTGSDDGHVD